VNDGRPSAVSPRVYAAVIALVFIVAAVLVGHWLLQRSERLVGTNSTAPMSYVFNLPAGQRMCVRDLFVPADAGAVRIDVTPAVKENARVSISLRTDSGFHADSSRVLSGPGYSDFPIPRTRHGSPGILCARATGTLAVSGFTQLLSNGRPQAFIDHKPQNGRVSVWFVDTRNRTLLSVLPKAPRRASVFRAGFVRPWIYPLVLLVLPLLWWSGLRELWKGRR
jgi:hypothetical protein